ncbi:Glycine zipper 2TM domain-containing protein [Noviherbaspirillum humi]|uniref:Glycine zipper 2TM domain-containing protein n=1 Tax=Noviherbaspirillum humi TaxID=1688639 RepID=A0A239DSK6_9BURK|nr:glycine zipper 2TM domain-containing protein [Noviherbaspirillum humi]SNS34908.1 Glycine zipper 2TM domain-containing protein [Noviherbaspirillum humi]
MQTTATSTSRIHPLVAGAAASVMLVSLLGAAAITGILPTSQGSVAPAASTVPAAPLAAVVPAPEAKPAAVASLAPQDAAPAVHQPSQKAARHHAPARSQQVAYSEPARQAQAAPVYQQPAPAPAPAARNSAVGIGVGAVVGGLLGSQVGGGNGRTLATIAGAVGGGYVGNEIAKRNP